MKTIVGLYDDIATARRVVEELAAAGFQRGDISLVANNQTTGTTTTGMTGGELFLFVHRELLSPPFMPLRSDRSELILNTP